jgi:hypothetical protein
MGHVVHVNSALVWFIEWANKQWFQKAIAAAQTDPSHT